MKKERQTQREKQNKKRRRGHSLTKFLIKAAVCVAHLSFAYVPAHSPPKICAQFKSNRQKAETKKRPVRTKEKDVRYP